jgi:hypothetical protein
MEKPLLGAGMWFPEMKVWVEHGGWNVNVSMHTDSQRKQFTDFLVSIAPLAKVIVVNETIGVIQQPRARIYEVEGELRCDYLYEEKFNENDLIRLANVFKAMIS